MRSERIVAIGTSAGGVDALKSLAAQLPADFPSPILVVQHIGKRPSILPGIIASAGPLGASHVRHGDALRTGHFHVAPPDHHLVVEDGHLMLSRGPKEHHARPAVDPLFRSLALSHGHAAVAIVLTGWGEDGTAGLQAIKSCGGITIAQDPTEARQSGMPLTALRYGVAGRAVKLEEMGAVLLEVLREPPPTSRECPPGVRHEQQLFLSRGEPMEHLGAIGQPSPYACPECGGGLWELDEAGPPRYRCHTGHAYTLRSLQHAQSEQTDAALWSAMRGLQEEASLLRAMSRATHDEGDTLAGARLEAAADGVSRQAARLRALVEKAPDDVAGDAPRLRAGD